jgi:hypothetical protein
MPGLEGHCCSQMLRRQVTGGLSSLEDEQGLEDKSALWTWGRGTATVYRTHMDRLGLNLCLLHIPSLNALPPHQTLHRTGADLCFTSKAVSWRAHLTGGEGERFSPSQPWGQVWDLLAMVQPQPSPPAVLHGVLDSKPQSHQGHPAFLPKGLAYGMDTWLSWAMGLVTSGSWRPGAPGACNLCSCLF